MSVPLDKLYSFLNGISNHALLIYGWQPHGSKKLQDLKFLQPAPNNWRNLRTTLPLIFHDQEPLDYDFLQHSVDKDFADTVKNWENCPLLSAELMEQNFKKMHIRSVLDISFYDQWLLVHSEKNSNQLDYFEQSNFVPVYYWSHAVIARDWFRFARHDPLLDIKNVDPKTFLVYNRAWTGTREYRIKFAEMLINAQLDQDCVTSFSQFDDQKLYKEHQFKNKKFVPGRQDLETILPPNTHKSTASADYNSLDYQHTRIEVVLETLFDDTRHHLTEKSLRPIACGQPFVLASTPGSLQYLRDYGFKTFAPLIDETYDTVQDASERLDAIIQEMKRISTMSVQQKNQLSMDLQPIAEHNKQLFFSEDFQNLIIEEFLKNLNPALEAVKNGPKGNTWNQLRKVARENYPDLFLKHMHQDPSDLEWANEWIKLNSKS